jgi:hypothetical protein
LPPTFSLPCLAKMSIVGAVKDRWCMALGEIPVRGR